jgi:hypothetical protein
MASELRRKVLVDQRRCSLSIDPRRPAGGLGVRQGLALRVSMCLTCPPKSRSERIRVELSESSFRVRCDLHARRPHPPGVTPSSVAPFTADLGPHRLPAGLDLVVHAPAFGRFLHQQHPVATHPSNRPRAGGGAMGATGWSGLLSSISIRTRHGTEV